jgi:hypothetical protein
MPATLPVLGAVTGAVTGVGGRGLHVVASPLGLHALRLSIAAGRRGGDLVVAVEGPALRPVTSALEGRPATASGGH